MNYQNYDEKLREIYRNHPEMLFKLMFFRSCLPYHLQGNFLTFVYHAYLIGQEKGMDSAIKKLDEKLSLL